MLSCEGNDGVKEIRAKVGVCYFFFKVCSYNSDTVNWSSCSIIHSSRLLEIFCLVAVSVSIKESEVISASKPRHISQTYNCVCPDSFDVSTDITEEEMEDQRRNNRTFG